MTLDDQPAKGYQGKTWSTMMREELLDALMYAARIIHTQEQKIIELDRQLRANERT